MDFLDTIYFGNSVRSYLGVIAVIVIAILIKRFLSRYIASLLYIPVKRSSSKIDKEIFVDLVVSPLEVFLVILISVLALDRLTFPSELNVPVYHVTTKQIIESILLGLLIITFINLLVRFIDFIALVIEHRQHALSHSDTQLIFFFKDFLKVILVIGGILLVLKFCFNAHIGQLITGLSIVGAALALAAKESLENLIASFIIFFDKPFTAGDLVRINSFQGNIERIGLMSTRLRTIDNTLVIVPNKQMVDSILDNWSMRKDIRFEIKVELDPKTNSEKIELAIDEINKLFQINKDVITTYNVFLVEISNKAALIQVEYFTGSELSIIGQSELRQKLNLGIRRIEEINDIQPSIANSFTMIQK